MPDLGNKLRDRRLALGYTLDDIQERTKIQKRYLESIEDGDFSRLPGSFYVRAFVRQYAEALDLNADELLEEIRPAASRVPVEEKKTEEYREQNASLSRIRNEKERLNYKYNKLFDLAPKILLGISILGIVFCIWKFVPPYFNKSDINKEQVEQNDTPQMNVNKNLEPADEAETPTDENTQNPEQTPEDTVEPPANFENHLSVVATEGNLTTYELKGADQFQLKLVSTGVSYVDIKDTAGEMVYAGEVAKGDDPSYDFTGEQSITLNIGRSTEMKVYINDEEVPYEIAPTDQVHQKLKINFVSTAS